MPNLRVSFFFPEITLSSTSHLLIFIIFKIFFSNIRKHCVDEVLRFDNRYVFLHSAVVDLNSMMKLRISWCFDSPNNQALKVKLNGYCVVNSFSTKQEF